MKLSPARSVIPLLLGTVSTLIVGCAPAVSAFSAREMGEPAYRIYDVANARFIEVDALATAALEGDVLFFGEFHDDAGVHRAQRDLLGELADRGQEVVVGLEMFERDVQPQLDRYLSGASDEGEFLQTTRPWPNYSSDYRPLLELAKERGWTVVGTNLPQNLATAIARGGLASLEEVSPAERLTAAQQIECPADQYWLRFIEAITGASENDDAHGAHAAADPMMRRVFEAQCARDETMAETIAPLIESNRLVFHVNGSFHSDHFLGIVPRLLRRAPDARLQVIAPVQVEDLAQPNLEEDLERGDYLVVTLNPSEGGGSGS